MHLLLTNPIPPTELEQSIHTSVPISLLESNPLASHIDKQT